jgi:hypothetical protein
MLWVLMVLRMALTLALALPHSLAQKTEVSAVAMSLTTQNPCPTPRELPTAARTALEDRYQPRLHIPAVVGLRAAVVFLWVAVSGQDTGPVVLMEEAGVRVMMEMEMTAVAVVPVVLVLGLAALGSPTLRMRMRMRMSK